MNLLITFYGQKRSDLFYYSSGGEQFALSVLERSYKTVLAKIASGDIDTSKRCRIVDAITAAQHVFRGGKKAKIGKKAAAAEKKRGESLLETVKAEMEKAAKAKKTKKTAKKKSGMLGTSECKMFIYKRK